jgi:hypothetical protein
VVAAGGLELRVEMAEEMVRPADWQAKAVQALRVVLEALEGLEVRQELDQSMDSWEDLEIVVVAVLEEMAVTVIPMEVEREREQVRVAMAPIPRVLQAAGVAAVVTEAGVVAVPARVVPLQEAVGVVQAHPGRPTRLRQTVAAFRTPPVVKGQLLLPFHHLHL